MAIISKTSAKTQPDPMEIPPELRSAPNGAAKPDVEALLARIAQLQAQVAKKSTLTLKVAQSRDVSLYGMGRFPVTLFGAQWLKVLDMADEIPAFIETNRDKLSWK